MKKFLSLLLCSLIIFPNLLRASEITEEEVEKEVARTTKYYKTVTSRTVSINTIDTIKPTSYTVEVSEDEYNSIKPEDVPQSATVETEYKKMTTSILQSNSRYKYQVVLEWKNMPKKRSHDIIGIGYYSDVKVILNPILSTEYCLKSGFCASQGMYIPQIFHNGVGASLDLPTGDLKSLKTTFYVYIDKVDSSDVITYQTAVGDYAHATSNISEANAQRYSIDMAGIFLDGVSDYYDSISEARTTWYGTW